MTKRQRTTEKLFSKAFEILSECPAPTKNGPKLVGTHDGTFHCDEALGCAMLQMMPQWAGSTIVRTRNLEELAKCDIVIDVGAVYDHATKRYDHHQRTFSSVLGEAHPDVETTACVAGQRCPSGLTGRGWPRLADASGSMSDDLALNAPPGSHLVEACATCFAAQVHPDVREAY